VKRSLTSLFVDTFVVAVAIDSVMGDGAGAVVRPDGRVVIWIVEGKGAKAKSVLDSGVRSRVDTLIL